MARIRSIHPAIFTDETFVALTHPARLLWIGLWCEADDQGVFSWKPLSLHMRLAPTSTEPVAGLLDELADADCVRRFEVEGRLFGVIRNFVKHQRPKRPREYHPLPKALRDFAGFRADGSRPDATTGRKRFETDDASDDLGSEHVPNTRETCSGERSQMETETETDNPVAAATGASAPPVPSAISASPDGRSLLFRDGLATVVALTGKTEAGTRPMIGRWLKSSRDDCRQVLRVIEDAREANPIDPVSWIEAALRGPRKPPTDSMAFVMARN